MKSSLNFSHQKQLKIEKSYRHQAVREAFYTLRFTVIVYLTHTKSQAYDARFGALRALIK